jgi:hypothetical protein
LPWLFYFLQSGEVKQKKQSGEAPRQGQGFGGLCPPDPNPGGAKGAKFFFCKGKNGRSPPRCGEFIFQKKNSYFKKRIHISKKENGFSNQRTSLLKPNFSFFT